MAITEKMMMEVQQSRILSKLQVLALDLEPNDRKLIIDTVKSYQSQPFLDRLEEVTKKTNEECLKDILRCNYLYSGIYSIETYSRITDTRVLTNILPTLDDVFTKRIILKKIKQLIKNKAEQS